MSEMLTEMVPGQEDSSDLELLQVRLTLAYVAWAECLARLSGEVPVLPTVVPWRRGSKAMLVHIQPYFLERGRSQ